MQTNVTILLGVASAVEFEQATEKMQALGVDLHRVVPRFRVLTGAVDESLIALLRSLPEVKAVEIEGIYQLDPAE